MAIKFKSILIMDPLKKGSMILNYGFVVGLFLLATSCICLTNEPNTSKNDTNPFKLLNPINLEFKPDTSRLIRNPGMGWVIYDDANDQVADASVYWVNQDQSARKYASVLYIRWRWSDMEPEEGKYAWEYDENFKVLVKGARDRHIRLAFRIYVDGQDNIKSATPEYVKNAGAEGYEVAKLNGGKNWSPYLDDSVFQQKFSRFIKAFSNKFDDPEAVDFVDGYNLGWWGEGHHLVFRDKRNKSKVFNWIIHLYGTSFKKVLLAITFGTENGLKMEKQIALDKYGYVLRRDGLGSKWFTNREKIFLAQNFPKTMFIGESCYWQCNTDDCKPWSGDPTYNSQATWKDVYTKTYNSAIASHANYLDLREFTETTGWLNRVPELVQGFVVNGGYRLYPSKISLPDTIKSGESFKIGHQWKNIGVGICPNNNMRWGNKYKIAFALISSSGKVKKILIDEKANPSDWFKGAENNYIFESTVKDIPPGDYYYAVAIINTENNNFPGITLAVDKPELAGGWLKISHVALTE